MNVPKLRFKEFTDEYKDYYINELGDVITGTTPPTNDKENYGNEYLWASPIDMGLYKYVYDTKNKLSEKGFKKVRPIPKDSILVTCIGSTIGKMGIAYKEMATNQQINTLICNKNFDNNYIYYCIEYNFPRFLNKIAFQAVPIISKSEFEKLMVNCSTNKLEQTKIANFLSLLDKKIELQTKKIENLKLFKLALQNNIYASINNKIKLEDIGCFISGYGFPEKYQGHKNLSIPFYKVSDMNNFGNEIYMNNSNNTLSLEICSHLKLRPIPNRSIIFAKIGAAIMLDRKRIATPPFLIDNNMMSYYINREDIDFDYIFYFLDSIKFSHYVQQGALPSLSSGDLGKIKIPFVNIQKQKIIGTTFNLYIRKIILEKEKLNKLFELKKGIMCNMFI